MTWRQDATSHPAWQPFVTWLETRFIEGCDRADWQAYRQGWEDANREMKQKIGEWVLSRERL